MIKIKSGVYGYRDKSGNVRPITSKDAAFSLLKEEEQRLVGRGVAVYVAEEAAPAEKPEYDTGTNANELKALMKAAGLTAKVGMRKEDMVAALDEFYGAEPEDENPDPDEGEDNPDGGDEPEGEDEPYEDDSDGEGPPVPGAEDPVP